VPLPKPELERELLHTRTISIHGYRRSDALWDVEGRLTDQRTQDVHFPGRVQRGGEPIHDMSIRLTVDATGLIVGIVAVTDIGPFQGVCGAIAPAYESLNGVRVGPGFRSTINKRFAGVLGCTHMTELLLAMGTGVIQTLVGSITHPADVKPFSLDGCHAFDTTGPVVAEFHPRWYRPLPLTEPET
jgi:hypothetical protein